jgi:hypothetical protein
MILTGSDHGEEVMDFDMIFRDTSMADLALFGTESHQCLHFAQNRFIYVTRTDFNLSRNMWLSKSERNLKYYQKLIFI